MSPATGELTVQGRLSDRQVAVNDNACESVRYYISHGRRYFLAECKQFGILLIEFVRDFKECTFGNVAVVNCAERQVTRCHKQAIDLFWRPPQMRVSAADIGQHGSSTFQAAKPVVEGILILGGISVAKNVQVDRVDGDQCDNFRIDFMHCLCRAVEEISEHFLSKGQCGIVGRLQQLATVLRPVVVLREGTEITVTGNMA